MAVFKAVTRADGKTVGHAKTNELEKYLKFRQDENGKYLRENGKLVPRDCIVSQLNAVPPDEDGDTLFDLSDFGDEMRHTLGLRDSFSKHCEEYGALFNTNKDYDSLKYKHYVQAFCAEDSELMTREKCHDLGV